VALDEESTLRTYRAMLERYPGSMIAMNNAAVSAERLGRTEESIDFARRGIRSSPDPFSNLYENLIWGLADLGRYEEAELQVDTMRTRFPGVSTEVMDALVRAGRTRDFRVVADTQAALLARAEDPGQRLLILESLYRFEAMQGRLATVDDFLSAAASEPSTTSDQALWLGIESLIVRLEATDDRQEVAQELDRLLARYPIDAMDPLDRPYEGLAFLQSLLGRNQEARVLLDAQARLLPEPWLRNNALRHAALGLLALAEDDPERAVGHLQDASRFRGRAALCHQCYTYELALALRAADNLETAARLLGASLDHAGVSQLFDGFGSRALQWRLLGDVNESLGRTDEAIAAYERFVELWADADPELKPQVEEIRGRIDRLLALKARETTG